MASDQSLHGCISFHHWDFCKVCRNLFYEALQITRLHINILQKELCFIQEKVFCTTVKHHGSKKKKMVLMSLWELTMVYKYMLSLIRQEYSSKDIR